MIYLAALALAIAVMLLIEVLVYLFPGIKCFLDGEHPTERRPVGGLRCRVCGKLGRDLEDFE